MKKIYLVFYHVMCGGGGDVLEKKRKEMLEV